MFIFTTVTITLASVGIILAVTSFISGLQLVRATSKSIEGMIHRGNGYFTVILFIALALIEVTGNAVNAFALMLPIAGLAVFMLKIWILRKSRRLLKYVSWMGGTLITIWILLFFVNIPS